MLEREAFGISIGRNVAYVNEWGSCASGILVEHQVIEMARVNLHIYNIQFPDGSIERVNGMIFGKEDLARMNLDPKYEKRIESYIKGTGRNPVEGLERLRDVLNELNPW